MDGCVFVYTSPDIAKKVFKRLYDELYQRHIKLIGHPGGVSRGGEAIGTGVFMSFLQGKQT